MHKTAASARHIIWSESNDFPFFSMKVPIIYRGAEIDDIDREKYDGKVVYEVEAESADGRRTEFVVAEDGSLIKIDGQLRGEYLPGQIEKPG